MGCGVQVILGHGPKKAKGEKDDALGSVAKVVDVGLHVVEDHLEQGMLVPETRNYVQSAL